MDSAFLLMLLAIFSGFNRLFPLGILTSSKKKTKDFFPGPTLASKQAFSAI
jgi:hypothetical protein